MARFGALGSVPGLAGFVGGQEEDRIAQESVLKQGAVLQGLLSRAQAQQQEQQIRGVLSQSGGDPAKAVQGLLQTGSPMGIELAAKLKGMMPKPPEDRVVAPGSSIVAADGTVRFTAPNRPVREQNPSNLTRLMEERDALPADDPRRKHYDNAIRKESETAKQISPTVVMPRPEQPLVSVVGPDGKPKLVRREDAIGMMPWAAGSAQDKKQETVDSGRESVNSMIATLRDQYTQLLQGGGITDPDAGPVDNIKAGISSSGLGQFVGRAVGTRNQSARNQIAQQRPLLLNAIKQATGMSAKQMDSNAELKLYLSAATDPTLDIRANMAALDKLDELYGLGLKKPSENGGGGLPDASAIDAELARRRKKK